MKNNRWLQSALTNDALVAELLLRLKHSSDLDSDSDSLRTPPPPATTKSITSILPPGWGNRKNRSKSTAPTAAVTTGYGKEHRGSPTTHLSWSGGGGSTSEESSRPSDLSSGCRSVKANEGASISSCCRNPIKRKVAITLPIQANLDQTRENSNLNLGRMKMRKMGENEQERGFVLPDLNMAPDEEDLMR